MFLRCFEWAFGWNKVKYAKNNYQTCFFHCVNTCQGTLEIIEELPWHPANVIQGTKHSTPLLVIMSEF